MGTERPGVGWIGRAAKAVEDGGVNFLAAQSIRKLTHSFLDFGKVILYYRELSSPRPPAFAPPDIRFRIASPEDTHRLMHAQQPTKGEAQVYARFGKGDTCVAAATATGEVVHTHWFSASRGEISEIGMQILLAPGEAYLYDSYTLPRMRGRGIERAASEFTCRALQDLGFTRTYGYVRGDNPRRLSAIRKWDRVLGAIYYARFRGSRPVVAPFDKRTIRVPLERIEWNSASAEWSSVSDMR